MKIRVVERLMKFMLFACFASLIITLVSSGPRPTVAQDVAQHQHGDCCHETLQVDAEKSCWVAFPIMAVFWQLNSNKSYVEMFFKYLFKHS